MAINRVSVPLNYVAANSAPDVLSRQLNDLRIQVRAIADAINSCPFVYGNGPFTITIPTGGTNTIFHGLDRLPVGYLILFTVGTNYFIEQITKDNKSITLKNNGAADVTVSVWVV